MAMISAVVLDTALRIPSLAVRLFATKWTSQITASRVSWLRQKENPAMPAPRHPPPQISSGSPDGPQHDVVLPHQSAYLALAVPIRTELEMLLDFDD